MSPGAERNRTELEEPTPEALCGADEVVLGCAVLVDEDEDGPASGALVDSWVS